MYVVAYFTDSGLPKTGLSSTIRIRKVLDNSLIITDAAMIEIGDGFYKYNFSIYDSTTEYIIRCDGGNSLEDEDRYVIAGNENYYSDIRDGILNDATRFSGADIIDIKSNLDTPDQYKADISSLAIEINVEDHVTNVLNIYDPPTKAELDLTELNIRGGIDTLDTLSSQLDTIHINVDKIKNIEEGNWKIQSNQMIFYDTSGMEMFRYNLFNSAGASSSENVFERRKV